MLVEARAQRLTLRAVGAGTRQDDEVPGLQPRVLTKRLARKTLELVAVHGSFRGAAGNRQTEPSAGTAARSREHGEEAIARTCGLGEHAPELGRRVQALVRREPCRVGEQRRAKAGPLGR